MMARIIDGKFLAAKLRARVADEVTRVQREERLTPGLAVILVGNNPASEVYVRSKHNQTKAAGMASFEHALPTDVAQHELLMLIARLNRDPLVHGILVQLPLPKSLDTEKIIAAIDPAKDVDGLHPHNAGRLPGADGKTRLVGDVAYQETLNVAGAITPVPGGVGHMTVACLLVNTLRAACTIHGLPAPKV